VSVSTKEQQVATDSKTVQCSAMTDNSDQSTAYAILVRQF